jgi:CRP/FNR family cyclic AMP-dependent transcriptional regulator
MSAPAEIKKPTSGPTVTQLKRGDVLFSEGDTSRAMYLLKTGMVRIYKKKGEAFIELDTVHSGQILGELAFLDGNPRSASAEAIGECSLVEISGPAFQDTLARCPEWLKILLKTIVSRLRNANTRIRQLESASVGMDYSDGVKNKNYAFINSIDCLKICTGLLLAASRGKKTPQNHFEFSVNTANRYVNQIMGIPTAKISSMVEIFVHNGIMETPNLWVHGATAIMKDDGFIDEFIRYLNEENLADSNKKHVISVKGYYIMSLILKALGPEALKNPKPGDLTSVNLAGIKIQQQATTGKEPFRWDEVTELTKLGYISSIDTRSTDESITQIDVFEFLKAYKFQRIQMALHALNEQKRSPTSGSTGRR